MARYEQTMIDITHGLAAVHGQRGPYASRVKVYVHKLVLWEKLNGQAAPCHWCGRALEWKKGTAGNALIADHLDGDESNNDPGNVVPSCNGCNTIRARGAFRPQIGDAELFVVDNHGRRTRADWCTCEVCGSRFLASLARIKRGTVRVCSRRCSNALSLRKRWGATPPR